MAPAVGVAEEGAEQLLFGIQQPVACCNVASVQSTTSTDKQQPQASHTALS